MIKLLLRIVVKDAVLTPVWNQPLHRNLQVVVAKEAVLNQLWNRLLSLHLWTIVEKAAAQSQPRLHQTESRHRIDALLLRFNLGSTLPWEWKKQMVAKLNAPKNSEPGSVMYVLLRSSAPVLPPAAEASGGLFLAQGYCGPAQ